MHASSSGNGGTGNDCGNGLGFVSTRPFPSLSSLADSDGGKKGSGRRIPSPSSSDPDERDDSEGVDAGDPELGSESRSSLENSARLNRKTRF